MELPRLARPKGVSPYATYGARRAVGTHYGDSDTLGLLQPTPSEGRQRWHYNTISSPHLPPSPFTISDDYGPPGDVGAWAPPPHPPGPQDLPKDYGPDGAAGGLSRSTPRQADDAATQPSGAGRRVSPTTGTRSQTTCYVRRCTGRMVHCLIIAHFILERRSPFIGWGTQLGS